MQGAIYAGNSNTVWLRELRNDVANTYINDATVTWQIRSEPWTAAGAEQGSQIASGSGTYQAGTDGVYHCDLENTIPLVVGTEYYIEVLAVKAGVGTFLGRSSFVARLRSD